MMPKTSRLTTVRVSSINQKRATLRTGASFSIFQGSLSGLFLSKTMTALCAQNSAPAAIPRRALLMHEPRQRVGVHVAAGDDDPDASNVCRKFIKKRGGDAERARRFDEYLQTKQQKL